MYRLILVILIPILAIAFLVATKSLCIETDMVEIIPFDMIGKRYVLGTVSGSSLERYAVIKEIESEKKGLYKQGDEINNKFKLIEICDKSIVLQPHNEIKEVILTPSAQARGLEFIETVELDTFEYWYRIPQPDKKIEDRRFNLVEIQGHKAILERLYKEEPFLKIEEAISYRDEEDGYEPSLDEIFIEELQTKKMGPDVWIVDAKSVSKSVTEKAEKALLNMADKLKKIGEGKLLFNSRAGQGTLDRDGFSVNSLSAEVRKKAGLLEGDVIKSVNGRKISGIFDIIYIIVEMRNKDLSSAEVKVERNGKIRTLTYVSKRR